jgi:hypothetical protein
MLCGTSSLLGQNIFLSSLFSKPPSELGDSVLEGQEGDGERGRERERGGRVR